jgi:phenylpyruvate tautomerase PptA (4-oxalocrotonate tautomerase family)
MSLPTYNVRSCEQINIWMLSTPARQSVTAEEKAPLIKGVSELLLG